jgi:hypothetical protein
VQKGISLALVEAKSSQPDLLVKANSPLPALFMCYVSQNSVMIATDRPATPYSDMPHFQVYQSFPITQFDGVF